MNRECGARQLWVGVTLRAQIVYLQLCSTRLMIDMMAPYCLNSCTASCPILAAAGPRPPQGAEVDSFVWSSICLPSQRCRS